MNETLSLIPLGGVGDVTKNMYIYEYANEILLIDCGIGFSNGNTPGVDLLLPDVSYLQSTSKKIIGMVLTHGHEDHIGALPFVLPQLKPFPIFGSPLTAALANEKLKEFGNDVRVKVVDFNQVPIILGNFSFSLLRVTHSVPDTAHIVIKTPLGNFYHGSDFKFDLTPADNKKSDLFGIAKTSNLNIKVLLSDCLGAERDEYTPSELVLSESFETEMRKTKGKFILTTYSSNISRLNQGIEVAQKLGRKVCFVGRSLVKAKEVAAKLGYLNLSPGMEIKVEQVKNFRDNKIMLLVAGSQGQEGSAMSRIASDEHKDIKLRKEDTVMFSSDPIPGNEIAVNILIDSIVKKGAKALYSDFSSKYHVSGHGGAYDLKLLMSLVKAKYVLPIGGTYRQMAVYKKLAKEIGYKDENILLIEDGQELIFSQDSVKRGKKISSRFVYVDEISGEEVDSYILHDRKRISEEGIVIPMVQIDSQNGNILDQPDLSVKGFALDAAQKAKLVSLIEQEIKRTVGKRSKKITDWNHIRKVILNIVEKQFYKELKRSPFVLPIIIEI